jgi:hypothetical protein
MISRSLIVRHKLVYSWLFNALSSRAEFDFRPRYRQALSCVVAVSNFLYRAHAARGGTANNTDSQQLVLSRAKATENRGAQVTRKFV